MTDDTRHMGKSQLLFLLLLTLALALLAAILVVRPRASEPISFRPFRDAGPGGPILVIAAEASPFTSYYSEILHAEGVNAFSVADISSISLQTLRDHKLAILGEMPLSQGQAAMLADWVAGGGKLIAMRPDKQLAPLLGLTDKKLTLADGYILADAATSPGEGILHQTLQFHGTADLYVGTNTTRVATLYSSADMPTPYVAVTLRTVGSKGGQAASFAYDLTRSIVYTRQGNPDWSGQRRDGQPWTRSDDLFFGDARFDHQPDWVDPNKIAIPQADEQQRLLANLILTMLAQPFPRYWYFPNGKRAVIVMTGDDHGHGGTKGRFDAYMAASPPGCSVEKWECIRATSYIYVDTPISVEQVDAYNAESFEIGLHLRTNPSDWLPTGIEIQNLGLLKWPKVEIHGCADWNSATLTSFYSTQLERWEQKFKGLPPPSTIRGHCIVWSDFISQPKVELKHNIRLDTNYYYYPAAWVKDRPGIFTGSGIPMRFADASGNVLDIYQAPTQMTDESGQSYPYTVDTLLNNALGSLGFYGAFVVNAHTDNAKSAVSDAVLASALSRGIPIVSARQMLIWLDGRNNSSFDSVSWDGRHLSFTTRIGVGALHLAEVMVPSNSRGQVLSSIQSGGKIVDYSIQNINGIQYAFFRAQPDRQYVVTYSSRI